MLKLNSRLNLVGLALSFTAFYLLMILVDFDLNYNQEIQDHERLYMLGTNEMAMSGHYQGNCCKYYGQMIKDSVPEIEGGFWFQCHDIQRPLYCKKNGRYSLYDWSISVCHGDIFKVIGVSPLQGSVDSLPLRSLVITQSLARNSGVTIGDTLKSDPQEGGCYAVRAVIPDFQKNSIFGEAAALCVGDGVADDDHHEWGYSFVYKARQNADMDMAKARIDSLVARHHINIGQMVDSGMGPQYCLFGFDDLYFGGEPSGDFVTGSYAQTIVWISIQIMIVLVSVVNFLNFFFARLPRKVKTINIHKVYGCSQARLVMMMVGETLLLVLAALVLAALAITAIAGSGLDFMVNDLPVGLAENSGPAAWTVLFAMALCVGISLYPAFYVAKISPAAGLKNSFVAPRRHQCLKYTMIGFQFLVTFFLLFFFSATKQNCRYLLDFDKGFCTDGVFGVPVSQKIAQAKDSVRASLMEYPEIEDATFASGEFVGKWRMFWGRLYNGKSYKFFCYRVDSNFPDFFGIKLLEGRGFDPADTLATQQIIFTESTKRTFGMSLSDTIPGFGSLLPVRGFVSDFYFLPLQIESSQFAFLYMPFSDEAAMRLSDMYVKAASGAGLQQVRARVAEVFAKYDPCLDVDKINVTDFYAQNGKHYRQNIKFANLLLAFSVISALICWLGLIGLVLFEAESRRKQTAIRRICGASMLDVLLSVNKRIFLSMAVAFAASVPCAMLTIQKYYSFFAMHAQFPPWHYLLGFIQVFLFTAAVLAASAFKTASESLAEVVKEE